MAIDRDLAAPDAPDAPPVLTVEALVGMGLARRMRTPGSKTGTTIYVSPEGHRALGDNQRERAERNALWRQAGAKRTP